MKDINKIVGSYCKSIFNSVQRQYSGRSNSRSWKNYPAVAVVCTDKSGICSRGTSNKVDGGFYKCTPVLASKLSTLGPIGVPSRFCKNRVGYCAEPHAARGMIIKHSCKLEKLFFSKALRPRTMECIKPCKNCKRTFSNL